jgi:V8-like Glu-specific endopeptidase
MPESILEPLLSDVTALIRDGDLDGAFERLENYLHENAPKLFQDLLGQAARYNTIRRRHLAGEVTPDQYSVEENKVRAWLLAFMKSLPLKIEQRFQPVAAVPLAATQPGPPQSSGEVAKDGDVANENQRILGINNLKQISWLAQGLQVCTSVCRILTPKGLGTGFLIGPRTIMTNNHVIGSPELAAHSIVEFDYQQDGSGKLMPSFRYSLDHGRFKSNKALDYTIVDLKPEDGKPALETWGRLQLNPNADPVPTEHVSIVQHPNGGLKQIVVTANQVVEVERPRLRYTTDTMPGSSGSPVFNDTWHVIAIHHSAAKTKTAKGYANEGILMSAIKPDAGEYWPA